MEQNNHYTGLSDAEVAESRRRHGVNVLTPPEKESLFRKFISKFTDPLIVILLVAGFLSIGIALYEFFGLQDVHGIRVFFEPLGIFIAIILATGLAFIFEVKADREFAILNQVNDDEQVQVIRNGHPTLVPKKDIVVGDIIMVGTGDEIPADCELLESISLSVDESSLTGEPIARKSTLEKDLDPNATYPTNHILRGTKVMEGHAVAVVRSVGDQTENGKVFTAATIDDSVKTPLNEQLEKLGGIITKVSYLLAALIILGRLLLYFRWAPLSLLLILPVAVFFFLLFNDFSFRPASRRNPDRRRGPAAVISIVAFFIVLMGMIVFLHHVLLPEEQLAYLFSYTMQTVMIAVTLIVVAVPEGLPMAVTLSLAYSMRRMLSTNNLVRKLHACETMGAATVICTDKTGTLTKNQMQIYRTDFYSQADPSSPEAAARKKLICEGIAVNSTAALDLSVPSRPQVLGNPTEGALLLWLNAEGVDYQKVREWVPVLDQIPFSTERKYMATLVRSGAADGKPVLYLKGAPEIVMGLCRRTDGDMDPHKIEEQLRGYQNQAMRTLGFACQVVEKNEDAIRDGELCASALEFLGIAAISDPVREDVPPAVQECLDAGIQVKIVTGDTPGTAKEIGRQIGLWKEGDGERNIITGPEFAALPDQELRSRIGDLKIISRARPMDKKRLVETLQARNEVVAVTGDGTNDAPALKAAQVGLSMGDGTSVAKEASDITIVDNSFSSIGRAVMWGRSLYKNIQRFILFQLTVNVAACLIVLTGAFLGTESPLTVTQMLWVNLIMDTFAAMALTSLPPSRSVMNEKPRERNAFIISRDMAYRISGLGGFFFGFLTALLILFKNVDLTYEAGLLSLGDAVWGTGNGLNRYELSVFFTFFVMLQYWNMFNARAYHTGRSAFHFKGCAGFVWITLFILIGQILIVSFGRDFMTVTPISLPDWIIIISVSSVVLWLGELIRMFTSRKTVQEHR